MDPSSTRAPSDQRYRRARTFDDARAAAGLAQFEMFMAMADCDDPTIWDDGSFDGLPDHYDGCRDMARWISAKVGITNFAARRWLHAAHALKELPLITEAFCRGELSLDKMLNLCRIATPDNEARLLRWAFRVSVSAVRDRADRECAVPVEEVAEEQSQRGLRHWKELSGSISLYGRFPEDQGKVIIDALDRIARLEVPELPTDTEREPDYFASPDGLDQRRADALYLMALGGNGVSGSEIPTIVVHTQLEGLLSGTIGAQFEGGSPLRHVTRRPDRPQSLPAPRAFKGPYGKRVRSGLYEPMGLNTFPGGDLKALRAGGIVGNPIGHHGARPRLQGFSWCASSTTISSTSISSLLRNKQDLPTRVGNTEVGRRV